jgi:CRP/FNR family transcriptional regulator, cyclic AMP receptor protein
VAQRLPREPLPLTTPLSAGTTLIRQGDACVRAWTVMSGVLIERIVSTDGRLLIPRLPGPGDVVGGLDGSPSSVGATALRRCAIRPASPRELEEGLAARERQALAFASELAWLDTPTAIERRLRQIADRFGRDAPGGRAIGLTLTQEELGAFAGTTRESANRAVAGLLRDGTLRRLARGRYLIRAPLRSVGSVTS